MTLEPAETRWPGRTVISHSGPNRTSQREPNLISPMRSPMRDAVAGLLGEDDAARDQSGDLFEDHGGAVARDGDDVLFVIAGALLAAGDQELALLVLHLLDGAADGGAVDVHVEDVEEDAEAIERRPRA